MLFTVLQRFYAKADFIQQFLQSPRSMGSITPSSDTLCSTMVECVDWSKIKRVAELGAGDGVLTHKLLQCLDEQALLDVFEINPRLVSKLRAISSPSLRVYAKSAEKMSARYDAIFSGLPQLSLPVELRRRILAQVHKSLAPGGVFVQFQYTSLTQQELSHYFTWRRIRVMRNFPPAWVYHCERSWNQSSAEGD